MATLGFEQAAEIAQTQGFGDVSDRDITAFTNALNKALYDAQDFGTGGARLNDQIPENTDWAVIPTQGADGTVACSATHFMHQSNWTVTDLDGAALSQSEIEGLTANTAYITVNPNGAFFKTGYHAADTHVEIDGSSIGHGMGAVDAILVSPDVFEGASSISYAAQSVKREGDEHAISYLTNAAFPTEAYLQCNAIAAEGGFDAQFSQARELATHLFTLGAPTTLEAGQTTQELGGCPASDGFHADGIAPIDFSTLQHLPGANVEVILDNNGQINGIALGDLVRFEQGAGARSVSLQDPANTSGCLEDVPSICATFVQQADGTTEVFSCIGEVPFYSYTPEASSVAIATGGNGNGGTGGINIGGGSGGINIGGSITGDIIGDTTEITNIFCSVVGNGNITGDICPDNDMTTVIITNPPDVTPVAPVPLSDYMGFGGLAFGICALAYMATRSKGPKATM